MSQLSNTVLQPMNHSRLTAVLVWCGIVIVSSLYITIPLTPLFTHNFTVSAETASLAGSVFSFCYAISFLYFGPLSERVGRKQVMFAGLLALAFITPLIGTVHQFMWVLILRGIQGVAAATYAPAALAYVVENYAPAKRVTAIGFVSSGFLLAGIIGQLFSGAISERFSWNAVFFVMGALYLLSALLLRKTLPQGSTSGHNTNFRQSTKQMLTVLFRKPLIYCYFLTITLLLEFVAMYTVLGTTLSQQPFHLNGTQMMLFRAAGIAGMLLSPFAGKLASKFGIKRVLQFGLLLSTGGLAALGFCNSLPLIITTSVLFVAGIALAAPTLISLIGILGGNERGAAVTLYTFILFIGATLGPIVGINLLGAGGSGLTFAVLALVSALGYFCTWKIKNAEDSRAV